MRKILGGNRFLPAYICKKQLLTKTGFQTKCLKALLSLAERVGFEPTVRCRITGFQDRLLKPLGHLSKATR